MVGVQVRRERFKDTWEVESRGVCVCVCVCVCVFQNKVNTLVYLWAGAQEPMAQERRRSRARVLWPGSGGRGRRGELPLQVREPSALISGHLWGQTGAETVCDEQPRHSQLAGKWLVE